MASRTFPQHIGGRPCLPTSAAWAAESFWPAELKQIRPASHLGRKAALQLQQISRIIFHRRKHYRLWSPESSKYPSTGILAGICALASGASLYGRWLVSALHRRRQEALRLLFPPAAGLVLLFFWGALSLVMTHGKWIASPWAILPQGGAPALWPGLHFRWLFGAISTILSLEILFSLAVGFTKLSSLDVGETPYTNRTMRAKTTRWLLLITATSMVVAACSVFTWGAELSLRTPEL